MSDTTQTPRSGPARHIPLLVILVVAAVGFFTLGDYLTFETLRDNREALLAWRDANYLAMVAAFASGKQTVRRRPSHKKPMITLVVSQCASPLSSFF